jgi:transposase
MKDAEVAYIGIDVSKETLDIDAGELGVTRIANTPLQVRKTLTLLIREAQAERPLQVRFESTGPYTGALIAECQVMGLPCSVLNPCKVRHFAMSVASAKTDAIDARLIRLYSEVKHPQPMQAPRKALAELDRLVLAREAVMKNIIALRGVLETLKGSCAAKPAQRIIAFCEKKIAEYDRLIAETVDTDAEVSGLAGALGTVKGIGELTAAKIIAGMPELGKLGRRKAAALAGLAPRTCESGKFKGKSRIGGGRRQVRNALFMPAAVAIRHNPEMKRLHEHLMAKGKPYKVALSAVMRRLLCHLESVAKNYYAKRKEISA